MATNKAPDEETRLTAEELEEFRQLLEAKKAKILDSSTEPQGIPDNDMLRLSDEVDLASAEYDEAFENRLRGREKFLVKKIDKALHRIADGEYDECDDCGAIIAKKRLLARPETTMCIECKEEQEKVEKMYEKKRDFRVTFDF